MKPVFRAQARSHGGQFRAEPVGMALQRGMNCLDEEGKWLHGILVPVPGQEVIEKDIDHDSSKTPSFRGEQAASSEELLVAVREAVEFAVHDDACDDFHGIGPLQGGGGALHKVAQEISDAGGIGGSGEVEMGEVVQD